MRNCINKYVSGDVKWAKGVQIKRPEDTVVKKWFNEMQ